MFTFETYLSTWKKKLKKSWRIERKAHEQNEWAHQWDQPKLSCGLTNRLEADLAFLFSTVQSKLNPHWCISSITMNATIKWKTWNKVLVEGYGQRRKPITALSQG